METRLNALFGSAGTGKLLTNETLVLTPEGYIKNKELTINSEVICEDGNPTKILNIWEGKDLNIYKVVFNDDTFIEACEDHLWKVQTTNLKSLKRNKYKVLSTKEMLKDFKSDNKIKSYKYSIPLCSPININAQLLTLHPYILGYMLGNGNFQEQITVSCPLKDAIEIKLIFDNLLPLNIKTTLLQTPLNKSSGTFTLSSEIKQYLSDLGLLWFYNSCKFIPNNYLYSSISDRLKILKGLMDSRGDINLSPSKVKKMTFNTTSNKLANDVMFLVRSLGGIAKLEQYIGNENFPTEYNVSIRINLNIFSLQRKSDLFIEGKIGDILNKKIVDIIYVGKKDGRCIQVENPLHTYVVENFVVTHNSYYINSKIQEDPKFALRTATTGIAALNLGSIRDATEATTINSALGYFNAESLLRAFCTKTIDKSLSKIAKKYNNIVIDEISLISASVLDLIVLSLDRFNKDYNKDLGLLISGDLAQLAPVEGAPIFRAKCWQRFEIKYLTEVKRQDNKEFIEALSCIRKGKIHECLDWLKNNISFVPEVDSYFRGTTFFSTNNEVEMHNKICLERLRGESRCYYATLTGVPHPTWNNFPLKLEVKKGSLVQLLYNNLKEGFANGDTAIVTDLWKNTLYLSLLRKNKEIFLKPQELLHFDFSKNRFANKQEAIGKLTVMRARLASAATIHRVQGLTLDKVQLCINGEGQRFLSKQSGMIYTALSRVKTPEGLVIVGTPEDLIKCCFIDPSYLKWIQ